MDKTFDSKPSDCVLEIKVICCCCCCGFDGRERECGLTWSDGDGVIVDFGGNVGEKRGTRLKNMVARGNWRRHDHMDFERAWNWEVLLWCELCLPMKMDFASVTWILVLVEG